MGVSNRGGTTAVSVGGQKPHPRLEARPRPPFTPSTVLWCAGHARALSSKVAVVRVVSMDMSATSSKPSKGRQRVALAMALVSSSPFYLGLTAVR